jgi:alkanesulfonate monooxygenase
MHLAAFMLSGHSSQAWRHPDIASDCEFDFDYYVRYAKLAERGLLDAVFLGDSTSVDPSKPDLLKRMSSVTAFEPSSLMSALAAVTRHLGLIYTATTTYNEPFLIARQVASLDHISGGRAGWNLVTSMSAAEAGNFGRDRHVEHDARYTMAREFLDVVRGLWDSFEDDAFIRDKQSGDYFSPEKMHVLRHQGEHFSVRGPMRMARPPQGQPIVAQAGASLAGRTLGAETADILFCNAHDVDEAKIFYDDVKARAVAAGRAPHEVSILSGVCVVWGETEEAAREKFDSIAAVYPLEMALENLVITMPDLLSHDLDAPFPDMPASQGSQGHQKVVSSYARRHGLTIRQTAQQLAASQKHRVVIGTAASIADQLESWFRAKAVDGFVLMPPFLIAGLADFIDHVVPELQRRGLFRTAYEGTTLRQNLGLSRPANRFAA